MLKLGVRVALAAVAAVVAVLLGMEGADLWSPGTRPLILLIVVAAVLAAVSTTWSAVEEFRTRRRGADRETLDGVLTAAIWAVVDATGLDARDLALAAYAVRGRLGRPPRLARLHRVRAARRPGASGIVWTPGKGVVGRCVTRGEVVAVDAAGLEADPGAWGLTEAEAEALRGKYQVVVAVPMVDDTGASSRVVGCVALDGPAGSLDLLDTPVVRGVLEAAGRAVRQGPPAFRSAAPRSLDTPGETEFRAAAARLGVTRAR